MSDLNIGPRDLSRLVSLPLRSSAVFNSFLATYARFSTPAGCTKCGRVSNPQAKQAQLINAAGAALKSISNTDKAALKKTLTTHFNVSSGSNVKVDLGGFKFVL
jgi:hypothetical protein